MFLFIGAFPRSASLDAGTRARFARPTENLSGTSDKPDQPSANPLPHAKSASKLNGFEHCAQCMAQTGHELEIFRFKQKVTRNQEFTPFPPEKNLLKKFSFQVCISKWAAA